MKIKSIIITGILLVTISPSIAQRGYSSASVSMNRANGVSSPDQVIVEEYINYHTHKIPLPQNNEEIALSLESNSISNETFILQVGISTKQLLDFSRMAPINVCLVIDVSGSMRSENKLEKVKNALLKFITGLRPDDYISIVSYNSDATIILKARKVGTIYNLQGIIGSLTGGGATNLHDGLTLGYEQVNIYFNPNHCNKVILLTDGIANVGVTDPEAIVKSSSRYNQDGIDVSTIGVGNNLNYSLLQQIAKNGKGENHFIGKHEEDIVKVFDRELESLLSPIAKQVYLNIEYSDNLKLNKIFGYTPQYKEKSIKLAIDNINSGLTQVILFELELKDAKIYSPINASLSYYSYREQTTKSISKKIYLQSDEAQPMNGNELMKNFYIGKMAISLKEMAKAVSEGKKYNAIQIIEGSLKEINKTFPYLKDKDIIRVKDILSKNLDELKRTNNLYEAQIQIR